MRRAAFKAIRRADNFVTADGMAKVSPEGGPPVIFLHVKGKWPRQSAAVVGGGIADFLAGTPLLMLEGG